MGCLLREADRPRRTTAACAADAMIGEQPVMLVECRLIQQGHAPIRKVSGMNQYNRFAGTPQLILEFYPIEDCSIHASIFHNSGLPDDN
jgi:hypothetical protein